MRGMLFPALMIILSLAGIGFGYLIAVFTPEEIQKGRPYFLWLQRVLLLALGVLAVLYSAENLTLLVLGILLGFSVRQAYLYLGLLLGLFSLGPSLLIVASLVFLYGFPTGSLLLKKKDTLLMTLRNLGFPLALAGGGFLLSLALPHSALNAVAGACLVLSALPHKA